MRLLDLVMASSAFLSADSRNLGMVILARLGRYAHDEEREAAIFLPGLRAEEVTLSEIEKAGASLDALELLAMLHTESYLLQANQVMQSGHIAAGRLLYCELLEKRNHEAVLSKGAATALASLDGWLPAEARESIKPNPLGPADIQALFSPRHSACNFI